MGLDKPTNIYYFTSFQKDCRIQKTRDQSSVEYADIFIYSFAKYLLSTYYVLGAPILRVCQPHACAHSPPSPVPSAFHLPGSAHAGRQAQAWAGKPRPHAKDCRHWICEWGSPDPMEEGRNKPRSLVELSSSYWGNPRLSRSQGACATLGDRQVLRD